MIRRCFKNKHVKSDRKRRESRFTQTATATMITMTRSQELLRKLSSDRLHLSPVDQQQQQQTSIASARSHSSEHRVNNEQSTTFCFCFCFLNSNFCFLVSIIFDTELVIRSIF